MNRRPIKSPLITFPDIFLTACLVALCFVMFKLGRTYQRLHSVPAPLIMQRLLNDCSKQLDEARK